MAGPFDPSAFPPREMVASLLGQVVSRGVCLIEVFSGGGAGGSSAYNYERQFVDAFSDVDFKDLLTLAFVRDADHTFTLISNQRKLISVIVDWITSAPFASGPAASLDSHVSGRP
jgi:hypothetical protein